MKGNGGKREKKAARRFCYHCLRVLLILTTPFELYGETVVRHGLALARNFYDVIRAGRCCDERRLAADSDRKRPRTNINQR